MTTETMLLNGLEDSRQALLAVLESVRQRLDWYTPLLDKRLYNDSQVIDTLRRRLIARPKLQVALLLPSAAGWRYDCPQLQALAERLSGAVEVRTLPAGEPRERPEFSQAFAIADETALWWQREPYHFSGSYHPDGSGTSWELLNFFRLIWDKSEPDIEMRRLPL